MNSKEAIAKAVRLFERLAIFDASLAGKAGRTSVPDFILAEADRLSLLILKEAGLIRLDNGTGGFTALGQQYAYEVLAARSERLN